MWERLNDILNSRVRAVLNRGLFLMAQSYHHYTFLLYSVDNDLVELLYDRRSNSVVWIMNANSDDLKKYLNKIELELGGLL
jgi:hypothetical protein